MKIILTFTSAIAILLLTSCQSAQDSEKAKVEKLTADSQQVIAQAKAALPKVEILEQTDVSESGSTYVVGTARAAESVSYAQLSFGVIDSGGNRIGTAMTNISNLKAGDTWKFKALILQKDAAQVTKPEIIAR
jgi:cellobiose-specific phosphotransferase system component IIA